MLDQLLDRVDRRDFTIGIIGLGYVGLPLALTSVAKGFKVLGFDVEQARVDQIMAGGTVIKHIPGEQFAGPIAEGRFEATSDMSRLAEPDAILIAVPTPLDKHQDPDLTYVEKSTESIAAALRPGQLVVLESTTWPGTTREIMQPILEAGGLKAGVDFFLAFSPEREDPGNAKFSNAAIPKVVGADDEGSL
ncbi:MAG: nucleotide sugar dehydrogenase, partial [Sphingomonas sp.]